MADQPPQPPYDPLPAVAPPEDLPEAPELVPVPLTAPDGQAQFVEEPSIEPQTAATAPDWGTKMFVLFYFLIVPPLGFVLLAAICWMLFKKLSAA